MRNALIERQTKETLVTLSLCLDGGSADVKTGSGFFDHMLTLFSSHASIGLTVRCKGDVEVDFHHSVEDVGIVLGQALKASLGDKKGVNRYGSIILPMDETLILCALDLSGRSYLSYDVPLNATRLTDDGDDLNPKVGAFDCELCEEFFLALTRTADITLHIKKLDGRNTHHILEGVFKAFGRALKEAVKVTGNDLPSTKGVL